MNIGGLTDQSQSILFLVSLGTIVVSLIGEVSVLISYHFYHNSEKGVGLLMVVSLVYANVIFSVSNLLEVTVIPDTVCEI
jgi:hypothetical protein